MDHEMRFRLVDEYPISMGERTKWRLTFGPTLESEEAQITITVDEGTYRRFDSAASYSREDLDLLTTRS